MRRLPAIVIAFLLLIGSIIAVNRRVTASETGIIPEYKWQKLTSHDQGADMHTWSPDGSEIAYITWDETSLGTLYKMNADGSGQSSLLITKVGAPDISPDGLKIACHGFGQIWIMDYDGTNNLPIYGVYTPSGGPGAAGNPRWSPTGDKLAVVELTTQYDRRIVTINSDGSDPTPLTDSIVNCGYPWWSPDGTKIAYTWNRDIWIMDSDGQNKHRITYFNDAGFPVWSLDGSSIFFCRYYGVSWAEAHIYKMNTDGEKVTQLTNSTGEWWPSISPNGKWMTFSRFDEGNARNIYKAELMQQICSTIDIDPDTLNLKGQGEWMTCYIELPEDYDANGIETSTILLNNTLAIDMEAPAEIGDYDEDNIPDLMVKFDRAIVISFIESNLDWTTPERTKPLIYAVNLMVTGNIDDGTPFAGADTIRVLMFLKGQPQPK